MGAAPRRRRSAQPTHLTALGLRPPPRRELSPDLQKYFAACDEKLGFLPNVLAAYSFNEVKLRSFIGFYNELMLGDSKLSKLEREMVAVVGVVGEPLMGVVTQLTRRAIFSLRAS